jgi:type I restriction enzyme S subunit
VTKRGFPDHWPLSTVQSVAAPAANSVVDGPFGSNLKLSDYVDDGVPVLQGKNITDDTFRWFEVRFISESKARELMRSSVRVGDILVVKIGSIGYSAVLRDLHGFDFAIIPANLAKITPNPLLIDTEFLHRWLASPDAKRYLAGAASKTAQPALSLTKIRALPVPLPPLSEQRRITDLLGRADALRNKRKAAIAELDTIAQSIFLDMFGDPAANERGWPLSTLAQICPPGGQYGANVPAASYDSALPRYVRITDISARGDLLGDPVSPGGGKELWSKYLLGTGDLLFARTGATVGKTYLHREENGSCVYAGYLIRFRTDSDRVDPEYLFQFTQTEAYRSWVRMRQRTVAQPNINAKQYGRELELPLPPLPIQREFGRRMYRLRVLRENQIAALGQLTALYESLQHRAFRGMV